MEHLNWEAGVCIFTAVLAFVTLMLAGYTYKIAVDADLNAKASVKQASTIHEEQQKLSQRQLLVPLWQYMMSMKPIKPHDLVQPDVLLAINALELVALCCEGKMIDELVIKRTFRQIFIQQYEAIEDCGSMEYFDGKTGKQILHENPATQAFYRKLKEEHLEKDKLDK